MRVGGSTIRSIAAARPGRRWLGPALAALAALAIFGTMIGTGISSAAEPGARPGTFLEGASVPRARALALDAAMLKGWYLAESGSEFTRFETILEEPASPGPGDGRLPPERTLLRIRADFIATPAGVNAYLQAQEVWWAGASGEWSTDVTDLYRANLMRALDSLQRQWTEVRRSRPGTLAQPAAQPRVRVERQALTLDADGQPVGGPDVVGDVPRPLNPEAPFSAAPPAAPPAAAPVSVPQTVPGSATAPTSMPRPTGTDAATPPPAPPAAPPTPQQPAPPLPERVEIGVWAYYAEQYARERGCEPGDLGAVLIGDAGGTIERHRVYCADGSTREVRCDRERCGDAR